MGRPRKYATNAERQSAYRARAKPVDKATPAEVVRAVESVSKGSHPNPKRTSCGAYAPFGTKCKFCGKSHA